LKGASKFLTVPGISADFQSAASPIFNRQSVEFSAARETIGQLAEWNSAIQQIENLRYEGGRRPQSLQG
jgi:hypothetical protein